MVLMINDFIKQPAQEQGGGSAHSDDAVGQGPSSAVPLILQSCFEGVCLLSCAALTTFSVNERRFIMESVVVRVHI